MPAPASMPRLAEATAVAVLAPTTETAATAPLARRTGLNCPGTGGVNAEAGMRGAATPSGWRERTRMVATSTPS